MLRNFDISYICLLITMLLVIYTYQLQCYYLCLEILMLFVDLRSFDVILCLEIWLLLANLRNFDVIS